MDHHEPPALTGPPTLEETVQAWHEAGHSQRAIARELDAELEVVRSSLSRLDADEATAVEIAVSLRTRYEQAARQSSQTGEV